MWIPQYNKQTLWDGFKREIIEKARERSKILVPKIIQDITELENKLDIILAGPDMTNEEKKTLGASLTEKLGQLQLKRYNAKKMSVQIRNKLEGEIIGRYCQRSTSQANQKT